MRPPAPVARDRGGHAAGRARRRTVTTQERILHNHRQRRSGGCPPPTGSGRHHGARRAPYRRGDLASSTRRLVGVQLDADTVERHQHRAHHRRRRRAAPAGRRGACGCTASEHRLLSRSLPARKSPPESTMSKPSSSMSSWRATSTAVSPSARPAQRRCGAPPRRPRRPPASPPGAAVRGGSMPRLNCSSSSAAERQPASVHSSSVSAGRRPAADVGVGDGAHRRIRHVAGRRPHRPGSMPCPSVRNVSPARFRPGGHRAGAGDQHDAVPVRLPARSATNESLTSSYSQRRPDAVDHPAQPRYVRFPVDAGQAEGRARSSSKPAAERERLARSPRGASPRAAQAHRLPVGRAVGGKSEQLPLVVDDHGVGLRAAAVDPQHEGHRAAPAER